MSTDKISDSLATDHVEITALVYRYATGVDSGDAAAVAELFTEDCEVRFRTGDPLRGPGELMSSLNRAFPRYLATNHYVTNIVIDVHSPDEASGSSLVLAWHRMIGHPDEDDFTMHARYVDTYARVDATWRIAKRSVVVAGTSGSDPSPDAWLRPEPAPPR